MVFILKYPKFKHRIATCRKQYSMVIYDIKKLATKIKI